jgi:hypothetical protein
MIYGDAPDAAGHPNHLVRSTRIVEPTDSIPAVLADGGGQAITLHRL